MVQRSKVWWTSLSVAVAFLLNACAASPDFKRPTAPASIRYSTEFHDKTTAETQSATMQQAVFGDAPPAQWWTLFHCDVLNRLMSNAIAGNQTLAAARASLAQSEALLAAQQGARLPEVDLVGGNGRQKLGAQFLGSFQIAPFTYYSVGAQVRYTLDYTGGVARSIEQRRAQAEYNRHELEAAKLSLTGNVATQFFVVASTRAQIDALESLLEEDRSNLDFVNQAFDAGTVTKVDVLSARAQLAQDQTLLPQLRQQLDVARHALAVLSGQSPADWADTLGVTSDLSGLQLPHDIPVSLPSDLVRRRPDILAAEAQLHAATAGYGVATADLYPRITLTATASQQAMSPERLFNASSFAWSLIDGITAPLFDGGRLRAERRAALELVHANAASYQQTVLRSFEQVADLLQALDHDHELLAAQLAADEAARSSVELARESYRSGNAGVLSVLDAERQSLQSRLGVLRAQSQQFMDTADLLLAMGAPEQAQQSK